MKLKRADGALVAVFAPDAPTVRVERTAWNEHRRNLFAAAGYPEEVLDLFEEARQAVLSGEDDEEVAKRFGLIAEDLWDWVELEF